MGRQILIVALLGLAWLHSAHGQTECLPGGQLSLAHTPSCPVSGDSVTVLVSGWFPNTCWTRAVLDTYMVSGTHLTIVCSTSYAAGVCLPVLVTYEIGVPLGQPAPGPYSVTLNLEEYISPIPFPLTVSCYSDFLVVDPAAHPPGDVNWDSLVTSSDILYLVGYVFTGGPPPQPCEVTGDVNCSGVINSADIIYEVNFVFKSGSPPCDVWNPSPVPRP